MAESGFKIQKITQPVMSEWPAHNTWSLLFCNAANCHTHRLQTQVKVKNSYLTQNLVSHNRN